MNKNSIDCIERAASKLYLFLALEEKVQDELIDLLQPSTQLAIKLIKLVSQEELTYLEISDQLEIHKNTACQVVNALYRGGYTEIYIKDDCSHNTRKLISGDYEQSADM